MNEILTRSQMFERYADQWLLIERPETDPDLHLIAGDVVFNSPDREAVYLKAIERKPKTCAFLHTGPLVGDFCLNL